MVVAVVVLAGSSLTTACVGWGPERLCSGDEVFVLRSESGSGAWCDPAGSTDRDCPDGERVRRIDDTGLEDCIVDLVGHERDGLAPQPVPS